MEHHPAYLVFQPYINNTVLHDCYLTKIEVSSDNDIAETYTVNPTTGALDASAVTNGDKIVLTTGGSSSNPNGFPLTNSSASVTTNGAYMVIKPGTHTLKVRYWVKDNATGTEGAITKTLPATAYASNTYYDMTANLNVRNYDGDKYYMWDAQEQYWKGHEWNLGGSQSTLTDLSPTSNYPRNSSDPNNRWFNTSFPGYGISNPATHTSCKDLPNVNEMTWYAAKGDPRWDGDELWTTMGHLYKGGIWFKKKANISGYNPNIAVDGTDWRTTDNSQQWSVSQTLPSAADAGNYFYLPALGYYDTGYLRHVGSYGNYWSSSAIPSSSNYAYAMHFDSSYVSVYINGYRFLGFRAEALFK